MISEYRTSDYDKSNQSVDTYKVGEKYKAGEIVTRGIYLYQAITDTVATKEINDDWKQIGVSDTFLHDWKPGKYLQGQVVLHEGRVLRALRETTKDPHTNHWEIITELQYDIEVKDKQITVDGEALDAVRVKKFQPGHYFKDEMVLHGGALWEVKEDGEITTPDEVHLKQLTPKLSDTYDIPAKRIKVGSLTLGLAILGHGFSLSNAMLQMGGAVIKQVKGFLYTDAMHIKRLLVHHVVIDGQVFFGKNVIKDDSITTGHVTVDTLKVKKIDGKVDVNGFSFGDEITRNNSHLLVVENYDVGKAPVDTEYSLEDWIAVGKAKKGKATWFATETGDIIFMQRSLAIDKRVIH